jgi:hypothetical protein
MTDKINYKHLHFIKVEKSDYIPGAYIDETTYYDCVGTPWKLSLNKSGEYSIYHTSVHSIIGYGMTVEDAFFHFKKKLSNRIEHLSIIQSEV